MKRPVRNRTAVFPVLASVGEEASRDELRSSHEGAHSGPLELDLMSAGLRVRSQGDRETSQALFNADARSIFELAGGCRNAVCFDDGDVGVQCEGRVHL